MAQDADMKLTFANQRPPQEGGYHDHTKVTDRVVIELRDKDGNVKETRTHEG